jgi:hypothetical protein
LDFGLEDKRRQPGRQDAKKRQEGQFLAFLGVLAATHLQFTPGIN